MINKGRITASEGGTIAMVAARIENTGSLSAQGGNVLLGAGNQVTLDLGGSVKLKVNKGSVDALIEQGGLIQADGGTVYIAASAVGDLAKTVINQTGVIEARTLATGKTGEIVLLGDMANDQINVAGTLDASAPAGGNGGFIETSAASVNIDPTVRITTEAASGKTGTWLVDPTDFTISAGTGSKTASGIGSQTLETMLASTNVTLPTSTAKTAGQKGDIHVNADVTWDRNTLTLNAAHSININADLNANGTAGLALNYGNTKGQKTAKPASGSGIFVGFDENANGGAGGFKGAVNFENTNQVLKINGVQYTLIGSEADLQAIGASKTSLAGRYALANSGITTSGVIGSLENPFTGVLEGLGHTVTLNINDSEGVGVGLFSVIGKAGTVSNTGVTGNVVGGETVGGLAGGNFGKVSRSFSSATVTAMDTEAGGLLGYNDKSGTVSGSYASGVVYASSQTGGLVGTNDGTISDSAVLQKAEVHGEYRTGGLVGENTGKITGARRRRGDG